VPHPPPAHANRLDDTHRAGVAAGEVDERLRDAVSGGRQHQSRRGDERAVEHHQRAELVDGDLFDRLERLGDRHAEEGLDELRRILPGAPAQPGEAWVYGYNTDILGCIVERASGEPLDQFFKTRIFDPLGMIDTHFFVPPDKAARLATVYASGPDGKIVRAPDGARGQGHYVTGPRRNFSGGAGLVSTARDYARFLEMVRNGGALGSTRLLSPRTVALSTHNQVGDLHNGPHLGWSLAFETTERVGGYGLDPVGGYGWGGACGSTYRVDPGARLVMVLMLNQLPNATDIRSKFQTLVHQAVVE
jgi:CubicO group peptidase (beta-lactamase class C family)